MNKTLCRQRTNFIKLFAIALLAAFIAASFIAFSGAKNAYADSADIGKAVIKSSNVNLSHTDKDIKSLLDWVEDNADDYFQCEVTIDLYTDWNTNSYGVIKVAKNTTYKVNLNGHMITRGKGNADFYGSGSGYLFYLEGTYTNLTINGGDKTIKHNGYLVNDSLGGSFWISDANNTSHPIYGGLITGGATDDSDGAGAIVVDNGGHLILDNVTVAGNISDTWSAFDKYGQGGAISVLEYSSAKIYNSKIIYNHAEGWGGAFYTGDVYTDITLENSEVSHNTSMSYGGGIAGENEGIVGDEMPIVWFELNLINSKISDNRAKKDGGGVYSYDYGSDISLSKASEISNNTTEGNGGGICTDSTDSHIYLDEKSSINENTASGSGGGIYMDEHNGIVSIKGNSNVSKNEAAKDGGGMYLYTTNLGSILNNTFTFDFDSMNICENTAGGKGGGIFVEANISSEDSSTFVFNGTTKINDNKADTGAGIYVNDEMRFKLNDTEFSGNTANSNGGAIYAADNTSITVTKAVFSKNSAQNGGGIYSGDYDFSLKSADAACTFSENSSSSNGAGIFTESSGEDITIEGVTFEKNISSNAGGGLYVDSNDTDVNLKTLTFKGNNAVKQGGGLYAAGDSDGIILEGATFTNNTAMDGGGVWFSGVMKMKNISAKNNSVTNNGGGIYCDNIESTVFRLLGDIYIYDNTSNGSNNNLAIRQDQKLRASSEDGKETLDAASYIGVNDPDFTSKTDTRLLSQTNEFGKRYEDSAMDILKSDDPAYKVIRLENNYICLNYDPSTYSVSVYGASSEPTKLKASYESTVQLKGSDYVKTVGDTSIEPYYWTLETSSGSEIINPVDGIASFEMPAQDVIVRAHYKLNLTTAVMTISDDARWAGWGTSTVACSVDRASLIDSSSSVHPTAVDTDKTISITDVSCEDTKDSKTGEVLEKTATYEIKIAKELLDSFSIEYDGSALKSSSVEVRTQFGTKKTENLTASLDANGNVIVKAKVSFSAPGKYKITVKAVNANDSTATAFDTFVKFASASTEGATITTVITPPDEEGWTFTDWDMENMPSEIGIIGGNNLTVTSITRDLTITAKYNPLVNKVEFGTDELEIGKSFASTISSCKVTDAAGTDMTGTTKDTATISWTKSDGSAVGSVVEADTTYRATVKTKMASSADLIYNFADVFYATLNGTNAESVTFDKESGTQTFTFLFKVESVKKVYSRVVTVFPTIELVDATNYINLLASQLRYEYTDGSRAIADISWQQPSVDVETQPQSFAIVGIFEDENGDEHSVEQAFKLVDIDAPSISPESGTYEQTVSVEITMPQTADKLVYSVSDPSAADVEKITSEGNVNIEVGTKSLIQAYALYGSRESAIVSKLISVDNTYSIAATSAKVYDKDGEEITKSYAGRTVKIIADEAPSGQVFDKWVVSDGVELADASSPETSFEMPSADVSVQATYKQEVTPVDPDDSDGKDSDSDKDDSGSKGADKADNSKQTNAKDADGKAAADKQAASKNNQPSKAGDALSVLPFVCVIICVIALIAAIVMIVIRRKNRR